MYAQQLGRSRNENRDMRACLKCGGSDHHERNCSAQFNEHSNRRGRNSLEQTPSRPQNGSASYITKRSSTAKALNEVSDSTNPPKPSPALRLHNQVLRAMSKDTELSVDAFNKEVKSDGPRIVMLDALVQKSFYNIDEIEDRSKISAPNCHESDAVKHAVTSILAPTTRARKSVQFEGIKMYHFHKKNAELDEKIRMLEKKLDEVDREGQLIQQRQEEMYAKSLSAFNALTRPLNQSTNQQLFDCALQRSFATSMGRIAPHPLVGFGASNGFATSFNGFMQPSMPVMFSFMAPQFGASVGYPAASYVNYGNGVHPHETKDSGDVLSPSRSASEQKVIKSPVRLAMVHARNVLKNASRPTIKTSRKTRIPPQSILV